MCFYRINFMHFKNNVSVVMMDYNTLFELIKRAIDSELNQDFNN